MIALLVGKTTHKRSLTFSTLTFSIRRFFSTSRNVCVILLISDALRTVQQIHNFEFEKKVLSPGFIAPIVGSELLPPLISPSSRYVSAASCLFLHYVAVFLALLLFFSVTAAATASGELRKLECVGTALAVEQTR